MPHHTPTPPEELERKKLVQFPVPRRQAQIDRENAEKELEDKQARDEADALLESMGNHPAGWMLARQQEKAARAKAAAEDVIPDNVSYLQDYRDR